jgi:hypothetical protein
VNLRWHQGAPWQAGQSPLPRAPRQPRPVPMIHRFVSVLCAVLALNVCLEAAEEKPATPPAEPAPAKTAPAKTAPAEPAPAEPTPDKPTPAKPTPDKPAPPAKPVSQEIFFEAALNGDVAGIRAALAGGTKAGQADEAGRTALMLASFNGHTEIARLLLQAGAPIDARDKTKRTALMYGSTAANLELVGLLLKKKAKVNLKDGQESWTPLMFAAAEGQTGVISLLLKAGADPHAKDVDGEDAALFARSKGHLETATIIEAAKAAKK